MRTSRMRFAFLPVIFLFLALLSCDLPGMSSEFLEATRTMQALATLVEAAESGQVAEGSVDDSSSVSEPEEAPTATSTACVPMVSVTTNTNCRLGPGEPYAYLGALVVGEEAQVVGQSSVSNFMIIDNPDNPGEQCWLWDMYAQVSCDISSLPVMEPPPLLPDWNGTWTCWSVEEADFDPNPFSVTVVHNGSQMTVYANVNGEECVYDVALDDDYMNATGTCPNPEYPADNHLSWSFLDNWNQLRGSVGGNWGPWCCARNGYPQPEPCENY